MRDYHINKFREKPLYKYEPWRVTEEEFKVEHNHHNEAIFALGNGYMGIRGTLEEDYSGPDYSTTPGVYINGVYASEDIIYGEHAPNLPSKSQTILNLADWMKINLFLDNEKFDMLKGEVSDYSRTLDFRRGTLTRKLIWTSPGGKKIQLKITRLISFMYHYLGVINYRVKPLNFSGKIRIVSAIDGDVQNYHHLRNKKPLKVIDNGRINGCSYLMQKAESTDIYVGFAMKNSLELAKTASLYKDKRFSKKREIVEEFTIKAEQNSSVVCNKYVSFFSSRDIVYVSYEKALMELIDNINNTSEKGYDFFLQNQQDFLDDYWDNVDVKIDGDPAVQQAFRFNAFHLIQSTGRGGLTNVAAKGLTGEFYEGHYFWDTETYIVPYFLYNDPEIARDLLIFRYNILEDARINARRVRLDGALFPWRTINGEEASGFFMGSTVQYHIDADVAYAIYLYVTTTGDQDFLYKFGVEILAETARMWVSRGSYIELRDNKFCLNEVCGPDEYKPGVNNNCYTNYMAKFNLEYAVRAVKAMKENAPEEYERLQENLNFREEEIEKWQKAADNMYLPYNQKLGIHPQDDSFLYKDPIDLEEIPEEEVPLVTNWHPLTIWRYQVIKQADVILLMLLQGDKFTLEEKRRNYDYYEPKTTHDSSLSPAIYSIIAAEIGYFADAYNYFRQTARLDLDDYNKNAYQGVHTACMGSTWMALVYGFAGFRNYDGKLQFNPYLPEPWDGYQFKIQIQNKQLQLKVDDSGAVYELLAGEELTFKHSGQKVKLKKNEPLKMSTRER